MNSSDQTTHYASFHQKIQKGKPSLLGVCAEKSLVDILDDDPILIRAIKSKDSKKLYNLQKTAGGRTMPFCLNSSDLRNLLNRNFWKVVQAISPIEHAQQTPKVK